MLLGPTIRTGIVPLIPSLFSLELWFNVSFHRQNGNCLNLTLKQIKLNYFVFLHFQPARLLNFPRYRIVRTNSHRVAGSRSDCVRVVTMAVAGRGVLRYCQLAGHLRGVLGPLHHHVQVCPGGHRILPWMCQRSPREHTLPSDCKYWIINVVKTLWTQPWWYVICEDAFNWHDAWSFLESEHRFLVL